MWMQQFGLEWAFRLLAEPPTALETLRGLQQPVPDLSRDRFDKGKPRKARS